jgi:hypothetical protein
MALYGRVSTVNAVLSLYPRVQDPYFALMIFRVDEGFSTGEGCNAGVTCRAQDRLTTTYWVYRNKLGMWGVGTWAMQVGPPGLEPGTVRL